MSDKMDYHLLGEGEPKRQSPKKPNHHIAIVALAACACLWYGRNAVHIKTSTPTSSLSFGHFPADGDPFSFIPCTAATIPPPLNDVRHHATWRSLFDPDPSHWSWGKKRTDNSSHCSPDPYEGRGIYLCGYLDAPLDYKNESETRIVRLAVTKYQVSGLSPKGLSKESNPRRGRKSERTIVIEPGGPGGSGTSYAWSSAQSITERFSDGKYDVLGFDPRGVNMSLPRASCFPFDADRDRWSLLTSQYRETFVAPSWHQLKLADSMNEATMMACKETLGDLPRFYSTALVARDVDSILTALGEPGLTGYFVSYGTGIGQTYANMFPNRVGRLILDGTEYVRDHRLVGGFGWTALDNGTDAWNYGFLGECVDAGPEHCALARPLLNDEGKVSLADLKFRMSKLFNSISHRPLPAYTPTSGPSLITYSQIVSGMYSAMYNAKAWPGVAQALYELEQGNTTLAANMLEQADWEFSPPAPCPSSNRNRASTDELGALVICADTYDAPKPFDVSMKDDDVEDDLDWWLTLWQNMTEKSWIAGNSRFYNVLPCRHYNQYFGSAAEVYRGDLDHTLSNPVLLIAEIYDPATPLRNGRRLLHEMGDNARLIVHHGYGHSSRDTSACTDKTAKAYMLHGLIPENNETDCHADEKPYRYSEAKAQANSDHDINDIEIWRQHQREMRMYGWG